MVVRACPLCGQELFANQPPEGRSRFECPNCRHQEAQDACPGCGGILTKDVIIPDGLTIEDHGLPVEHCHVAWHCARCEFTETAPEGMS